MQDAPSDSSADILVLGDADGPAQSEISPTRRSKRRKKAVESAASNGAASEDESILVLHNNCNETQDNSEYLLNSKTGRYIIICRHGAFQKEFYFEGSELVGEIYDSLFSEGKSGRICHEGSRLSRYLSIADSGFFPGMNYITIDGEKEFKLKDQVTLKIQRNAYAEDDMELVFDKTKGIDDLVGWITRTYDLDESSVELVFNGIPMPRDVAINERLSDDDVLDLVVIRE